MLRLLGELVELVIRQAERKAQVADRAAYLVGGERAGQRGVLPAVSQMHALEELLADIAREVEVDVRG